MKKIVENNLNQLYYIKSEYDSDYTDKIKLKLY